MFILGSFDVFGFCCSGVFLPCCINLFQISVLLCLGTRLCQAIATHYYATHKLGLFGSGVLAAMSTCLKA